MGQLSQKHVPSMGLQSEDSGKASAAGLGGQGLVVARPGLEVSPTIAGRCSPDQGSDPASVLSACPKMVESQELQGRPLPVGVPGILMR